MGYSLSAVRLPGMMRLVSGLFCLTVMSGAARAECADLALVLAIDGSGSIDPEDFDLQQAGYAAAFRDVRVQRALDATGLVDVAVVLWGDAFMPVQTLGFRRLAGSGDADRFAERIAALERVVSGNTGISKGLWAALDLLDAPGQCAWREVVNISGDGWETLDPRRSSHVSLGAARDRARTMGVTVNGLAITVDQADLAAWYRDKVITGPGAFVISVGAFGDFGDAIIRKLEREIGPQTVASLDH